MLKFACKYQKIFWKSKHVIIYEMNYKKINVNYIITLKIIIVYFLILSETEIVQILFRESNNMLLWVYEPNEIRTDFTPHLPL